MLKPPRALDAGPIFDVEPTPPLSWGPGAPAASPAWEGFEGPLVEVRFQEGQDVKESEMVARMETAKAVVEVYSPRAGTITTLHGSPGDTIKVHTPFITYKSEAGEPQAPSPDNGNPESAQAEPLETSVDDAFDVNGAKVSEVRRISLDAGSNLDHIQVSYKGGSALTAGLGLRKMPGDKKQFNKEHGWLSKWEKMEKNGGEQGVAIVVDPKLIEKDGEDKQNDLLLVKVPGNNTIDYWAGFCWDKAGQLTSEEPCNKYVDEASQGAASPIEVNLEK